MSKSPLYHNAPFVSLSGMGATLENLRGLASGAGRGPELDGRDVGGAIILCDRCSFTGSDAGASGATYAYVNKNQQR